MTPGAAREALYEIRRQQAGPAEYHEYGTCETVAGSQVTRPHSIHVLRPEPESGRCDFLHFVPQDLGAAGKQIRPLALAGPLMHQYRCQQRARRSQ